MRFIKPTTFTFLLMVSLCFYFATSDAITLAEFLIISELVLVATILQEILIEIRKN